MPLTGPALVAAAPARPGRRPEAARPHHDGGALRALRLPVVAVARADRLGRRAGARRRRHRRRRRGAVVGAWRPATSPSRAFVVAALRQRHDDRLVRVLRPRGDAAAPEPRRAQPRRWPALAGATAVAAPAPRSRRSSTTRPRAVGVVALAAVSLFLLLRRLRRAARGPSPPAGPPSSLTAAATSGLAPEVVAYGPRACRPRPPRRCSAQHGLHVTAQRAGRAARGVRPAPQHGRRHLHGRAQPSSAPSRARPSTTPSPPSPTGACSGASSPPARRPATRTASATTTTTSCAGRAARWSTSTARWATPRASPPPTTPATRSTRPRSSTGAAAPTCAAAPIRPTTHAP